jgi:poly(A) polymerase
LSAERVAQELAKLLETSDPIAALRMMQEDGVLPVVLPEARRLDRLQRMIEIEPEIDPLRRLAALIDADASRAAALAERLRFSNAWRDRLQGLATPWPLDPQGDPRTQRRGLYRLGTERYRDIALLQAADGVISAARLGEFLTLARDWTAPRFPLAGRDVVALGIPPGERVGQLVDAVRDWWEAGDFTADRASCLAYLRTLVTVPSRMPNDGGAR